MPLRQRQQRDDEALLCTRRRICLPLSFSDVRRIFSSLSHKPECVSDSIPTKASLLGALGENPVETNLETLDKCPREAPMSPAPSSTTVGETLHDDDCLSSSESFLPIVLIPLRLRIFFMYAPSTADLDEDYGGPPLLRVHGVEAEFCGILRVVAEDPDNQTIRASMSELLIDARAHCEDEPRLLCLVGARVNKGRIERLSLDAANSVCCDVRRRCVMRGEEEMLQIPVEQAVEEILNLEKQRQNANLETYQRQICSSMMQSQRRRYLGLPTNSCPF